MDSRKLAEQMAEDIVQAYIDHDGLNYKKASHLFAKVFINLFHVDTEVMAKAADAYTEALRQHDLIEDDAALTKEEKLAHRGWIGVRGALNEFCQYLGISDAFAREATEYFRLHGQREGQFVQHLYNADVAFTKAIIGNGVEKPHAVHALLAGLYLSCVGGHDFHDTLGIKMMKQLVGIYYEFLLTNRKRQRN